MFLLKALFQLFVLVIVLCNTVERHWAQTSALKDFLSQGKTMYRLVTVICGLRGVGLDRCCLN